MRKRRTIIIPAILALGIGGSILAGSAVPVAAAQASGAHAQVAAVSVPHYTWYHG